MKRISPWVVAGFTLFAWQGTAETLEPPPEGKSVVYLGRMTGFVGRGRPFHFFDGENYLARIKGKNYIRYVCAPGEHLFWVAAEARSFVKADLEAGRSYALWAKLQAGTWTARAALLPITTGSEAWSEFSGMIRSTKATPIDPTYIAKWEKKHPTYVQIELEKWKESGEPGMKLRPDEYIE